MRLSAILASILFMLIAVCCASIAAGDEPATTSTEVSRTHDKDKADADKKAEEIRLEIEKRKEVERKERRERHRERHDDDNYNTSTTSSGSGTSSGGGIFAVLFQGLQTANAGVVYAPGSSDREPAYGLQWLSSHRFGAALWFSGSADRGNGVIDASIPHGDYVNEDSHSSFALEGLYNAGTEKLALIFGAGFAVQQTYHTQVSNATGWRWNGGSDSKVKPVAQIGCILRMSDRAALSVGYDTLQSAYFGFSIGF